MTSYHIYTAYFSLFFINGSLLLQLFFLFYFSLLLCFSLSVSLGVFWFLGICVCKRQNIFVFCRINIFGRAKIFNWILFVISAVVVVVTHKTQKHNATCGKCLSGRGSVAYSILVMCSMIRKVSTDFQCDWRPESQQISFVSNFQ